jgi:hypothetical protein
MSAERPEERNCFVRTGGRSINRRGFSRKNPLIKVNTGFKREINIGSFNRNGKGERKRAAVGNLTFSKY